MVYTAIFASPTPARIFLVSEGRKTDVGTVLAEIRKKKRFSMRALGREAGISASYIAQLESGTPDARSGKTPRPTPSVLRMLASALGDGNEEEAEDFYQRLMTAAGYLKQAPPAPPARQPELADKPSVQVITRAVRDNPEIPERVQRAVLEMLELTEEINRKALEDEAKG